MERELAHFPLCLLEVSLGPSIPSNMAAAIYLKNFVKKHWKIISLSGEIDENEHDMLSDADATGSELSINERRTLRGALLDALQARCINSSISQIISESISQIASRDFVLGDWPELLPFISTLLQDNDSLKKCCALQVCDSIFSRYRHEFRTDSLFREINMVMETLAVPLLAVFVSECGQDKNLFFREQRLLLDIFYSLSAQDIPAFFEENFGTRIAPVIDRILSEYGDNQDLVQVHVSACEFIRLYVMRYEEEVGEYLVPLVVSILRLLSSSMNSTSTYELVISEALSVIAAVFRRARFRTLFDEPSMLTAVIERIVLPSLLLHESDEEAVGTTISEATDWILAHFMDEFTTGLKKPASSHGELRRRPAAEEVLQALITTYPDAVKSLLEGFLTAARSSTDWRLREASIVIYIAMFSVRKALSHGTGISFDNNNNRQAVLVLENEIIPLLKELLPVLSNAFVPLSSPTAFLAAMALRFCAFSIDFVRTLDPNLFQLLVSLIMGKFLHIQNPLVHLSAALFLERVISSNMKETIFQTEQAFEAIKVLIGLIEGQVASLSHEPEILMRLVVYLMYQMKEQLNSPMMVNLLQVFSILVKRCGPSPKNPLFTRWIWEALGLLGFFCPISRDHILRVPISLTLQEGYGDYIPYALLALGIVIGADTTKELDHSQATLMLAKGFIPALLTPETWQPELVGSLGRVVEAYVSANLFGMEYQSTLNTLLTVVLLAPESSPLKLITGIRILRTMLSRDGSQIETPFIHTIASLLEKARPEGIRRRLAKPFVRFFIHAAAVSALDLGNLLKSLSDVMNFFSPEALGASLWGRSGGETLGLLRLWRHTLALGMQHVSLANASISSICWFRDNVSRDISNYEAFLIWSPSSNTGGGIKLMASDAIDVPERMLSVLPVTLPQLEHELNLCIQSSTQELLNCLSEENRAQLARFTK